MRDHFFANNAQIDIVLFDQYRAEAVDSLIAAGQLERIPNKSDRGFIYRISL